MSRFHQQLRERLKNPEIAAGYQEMSSAIELLQALDSLRQQSKISTDELARRMGRQRASVSRLLNAEHPNPTLDTISDLLSALGITAEVQLRPAREGEPPIKIAS